MALSGAPERTTIVTSNASLSLQTTPCRLLRRVVPWSPVIPVELVPIEPGGDNRERRGVGLARVLALPQSAQHAAHPVVRDRKVALVVGAPRFPYGKPLADR